MRAQLDVMEKDVENAHISSTDKNKQAKVKTQKVDQYT